MINDPRRLEVHPDDLPLNDVRAIANRTAKECAEERAKAYGLLAKSYQLLCVLDRMLVRR
jgi:hypothetical protein